MIFTIFAEHEAVANEVRATLQISSSCLCFFRIICNIWVSGAVPTAVYRLYLDCGSFSCCMVLTQCLFRLSTLLRAQCAQYEGRLKVLVPADAGPYVFSKSKLERFFSNFCNLLSNFLLTFRNQSSEKFNDYRCEISENLRIYLGYFDLLHKNC